MTLYRAPTEGDYAARLNELGQKFNEAWEVELMFRIAHLGDVFSSQYGWPLNGMEGVMLELIRRHNWTPVEIENLTPNHFVVVFAEDRALHELTDHASNLLGQWIRRYGQR